MIEETLVVLDTNVLIAAGFNPRSHAACIVEAVRAGRLRMAWSDATRRESERLLRRIPPLSWESFRGLFDGAGQFDVDVDVASFGHIPDPEDRKFAALAQAANAALITQDDDLLAQRSIADVPYLTPREFVRFVLREEAADVDRRRR